MQNSCSSEVGIAIGATIIAVCLVVTVIIANCCAVLMEVREQLRNLDIWCSICLRIQCPEIMQKFLYSEVYMTHQLEMHQVKKEI